MALDRNKLYLIIFIACMAGYIWLYLSMYNNQSEINSLNTCFIKHTTNIPCPSCGSTRSVISLLHGNFNTALYINPLGFVIVLIMLFAPLWMILDFTTKRKTLFDFYNKIEHHLKKPHYAISLVLLVIANWIWNITKGL